MYQVDSANSAATIQAPAAAGPAGYFQDETSPGTVVPADWLNVVQQELINIVLAGGGVPTKPTTTSPTDTNRKQVLTAIQALIAACLASAEAAATADAAAAQSAAEAYALSLVGSRTDGSGAPTLPAAGSAAGTVGSSGYEVCSNGRIRQWAYIQLQDPGSSSDTPHPWVFPIPFPNQCLGVKGTNYSLMAGQGGSGAPARIAILNVYNQEPGYAELTLHNTGTGGTLCVFYVEAEGY